jgi:uncharacterized protein YacL
MTAPPVATAFTVPDDEPAVATAVLLLVHVPTVVASVNTADDPMHRLLTPAMAAGAIFTVIGLMTAHPVPNEYFMVSMPGETPVIRPVVPVVAMAGIVLLHTPPVELSDKVKTDPTHTLLLPPIGFGIGLTVTVLVTYTLPQPNVAV